MLLESVDSGTTVLLSQHWLPDAELDRVMQTYDKDANGVIDFEEFQNIVYDGLLLDGMLSEYEEAFAAVDRSGNGTIGAMELQELFQKIGQPMSFEKLSDMMLQYDRDESGQIEFTEFLMMCRDQLLDLKDIQNYMSSSPSLEKSQSVLDASEGEISIIFSRQELDAVLSIKDKLTVVFAAMTWCRPCKAMQRPAQKLAQHYKETFNFVKLFGNSNQQTKQLFKETLKIRSTPCFMIFKGTELLYTQTGKNQAKLEDALRSLTPSEKVPETRVYENE